MGPADAPPPSETSTGLRGSGVDGALMPGRAGTSGTVPPRQLLDQLRVERQRLERDIAVEQGRAAVGRLRPAAVGSTQDRIELGTLVLRAQEDVDIVEFEHGRAIEAIRVAADREATRILAAAHREAALMAAAADGLTADLSTDAELAGAFAGDPAETALSGTEGDAVRPERTVPRTKSRVRQAGGNSSTASDLGTTQKARRVDAG